jgi:signal transduction histidine kinase
MSSRPILTLPLQTEQDVVNARQRARNVARLVGFKGQDQTRIATAVSEIARNTVVYGKGGTLRFSIDGPADEQILTMSFADQGPGVANLQTVLDGQYVSETGMGIGITGTRRLMDRFEIDSAPGNGTRVRFGKYLPRRAGRIDPSALAGGLDAASAEMMVDELLTQNRDLLATLTELETARSELTEANTELENTNRGVVALYAELDQRAEELRRASEVKSQFLSSMSHELRTPLNSILALSRLLSDQVDGELNVEQMRQVTYISHSAQALTALVNDLLDLAKVEAGKVDLHESEFTTGEIVGALRGVMRPLQTTDAVELVFEDKTGGLRLRTDEGKLAQILRNLVSNALKFTEQGEVRVTVTAPTPGRVVFTVSDTGIGLAKADIPRIFEEFVQVRNALQARHKGSGLGLPLSRRLAGLLGGVIEVESEPGKGSTFVVDIPLVLPGADDAAASTPEGGRTILIIDDEEATRYVLRQSLRSEGLWNVFEAKDGVEGLQIAQSQMPDFIVLDLNMPDLDGFELFRTLKGDPATAHIPILVVTSMLLTPNVLSRLEGAVAVLPKSNLMRGSLATFVRRSFGAGEAA